MSFSIGSSSANMGPRGALERFSGDTEGSAFDSHVVTRMLAYLRPHWQYMLFRTLLMLVATVLTLLTPYLLKVAIDQYITQSDAASVNRRAIWISATFIGTYVTPACHS